MKKVRISYFIGNHPSVIYTEAESEAIALLEIIEEMSAEEKKQASDFTTEEVVWRRPGT